MLTIRGPATFKMELNTSQISFNHFNCLYYEQGENLLVMIITQLAMKQLKAGIEIMDLKYFYLLIVKKATMLKIPYKRNKI